MNEINRCERFKIFLFNLGKTLKKSAIWLVLSYVIPILNIAILIGVNDGILEMNLNVISIIIATNSCVITSLLHLFYINNKKREFIYVLSIVTIVTSVALFVLCVIQTVLNQQIMNIAIYEVGSYITLGISIIFLLISKYDEIEALSTYQARKGHNATETIIDDKKIKL